MRERLCSLGAVTVAVLVLGAPTSPVRGDITGFTPGTYQYTPDDVGSPPVVGADSIQLTTGVNQRRSIFFFDPQDVMQFSASFTYRAENLTSGNVQGLMFVVQNNPDGVNALGGSFGNLGGVTGLGYAGMADSAAVSIETNASLVQSYHGYFTNGNYPTNGSLGGGSGPTSPVNVFDGNEIDVSIVYDGSILTVTMIDALTGDGLVRAHLVGSIASTIGSSTAYVGFTASSSGGQGADQYLSNFRFSQAIPAPGALALLAVAGASGRRRRRSAS